MVDLIQGLYVVGLLGSAIIAGRFLAPYVVRIYSRAPDRADRILNPVEGAIYRIVGVKPGRSMGWKEYFLSAVFVNLAQMAVAFVILTYQGILPLNP